MINDKILTYFEKQPNKHWVANGKYGPSQQDEVIISNNTLTLTSCMLQKYKSHLWRATEFQSNVKSLHLY